MVRVVWLDSGAHVDHGWASAAQYMSTDLSRKVTTVGMLVDESDDVVAVGLNFDPDTDNWFGVELIYRPTIVSFHELVTTS